MDKAATLGAMAGAGITPALLQEKGLSEESASRKGKLFAESTGRLLRENLPAETPIQAWLVPGRIEVLGKHTDYVGGRSLVAAADRGFCLVAAPRNDARVRIIDASWNQQVDFLIGPELSPAAGHWSNYPMTVARRLARNFPGPLRGADVAFASDLPAASGMSSSSAMIVASFLTLCGANELEKTQPYRRNIHGPESLAEYLGAIENGQSYGALAGDKGVGTFGGSEDHTAILRCRAGRINQYSYCPIRFERSLAVPADHVFAIASSGVLAEKTGAAMAKYNRVSRLARAAVEAWRTATGGAEAHLAAVVAGSPEAAEKMRKMLSQSRCDGFEGRELLERFEHFYAESERIIPAAGDALAAGNVEEFGRQVAASQEGAEKLLGNQAPETIFLARNARDLGAAAASAFGAGFGGSVWALVKSAAAERMAQEWSRAYQHEFPQSAARSKFFLTGAGPAAFQLA